MEDEVGVIAMGMRADVIAVAGNPQIDVKALRNVKLVLQGGRVVFDGAWSDEAEVKG
jgi:imidazolonepropionase-like amidohydrolase